MGIGAIHHPTLRSRWLLVGSLECNTTHPPKIPVTLFEHYKDSTTPFIIYSHFKQICNIRLYLQTLSRKGIERLPIPKKCRILKQNDYIFYKCPEIAI
jgi:hypothetical protein